MALVSTTYLLLPVTCTDFVPHDASLWHAVAVTVKVLVELSHPSGNMEHKSAPVTHRKAASVTIAAGHVSAACVASVALHAYVSEMLESAVLQPVVAVACRLISVLDVAPVTSPGMARSSGMEKQWNWRLRRRRAINSRVGWAPSGPAFSWA